MKKNPFTGPFVGIIVVRINPADYREKILLTKDYEKFKLRFPGGGFDPQEGDKDLLDTAVRELKEEVGLEAQKEDFEFVTKLVRSSDQGGKHEKHFFTTLLVAEDEPKITLGNEVEHYQWVDKQNLEMLIKNQKITRDHGVALEEFFKNRNRSR